MEAHTQNFAQGPRQSHDRYAGRYREVVLQDRWEGRQDEGLQIPL